MNEPYQLVIDTAVALVAKEAKARKNGNDKADQFAIAAGKRLQECFDRKPANITWSDFCKNNFPFARSRADELRMIGTEKTTVDKIRIRKRDSMQKVRSKLPPRGGNTRQITKQKEPLKEIGKFIMLPQSEAVTKQANQFATEPVGFFDNYEKRLMRWIDAHPEFNKAGRLMLANSLSVSAEVLLRLVDALKH